MKYKALKEKFNTSLYPFYDEQESSGMFFIVIQQVAGLSRMQFLEEKESEAEPQVLAACLSILDELCTGKPIQYILKEAWFYRLPFVVGPDVLIPRDETEELVDMIIKTEQSTAGKGKQLLDIGTGSGCIAIALKKNLPNFEVFALDVSPGALSIAQENAKRNAVEVTFIEADILKYEPTGKYDIIVSNPPYVKNDERQAMHQNVLKFEPHTALFVPDQDPLIFYRAIAFFASATLVEGGSLYFEINEYLGAEMVSLMKEKGFQDVRLIQDMQGKDRMLSCRSNSAGDRT